MKRVNILIALVGLLTSICTSTVPLFALAANTNGIINPSVELSSMLSQPANWTSNSWGTNSATFDYAANGYNSTHSLVTTLASRTSGDAKWIPDATLITAGQSYIYSDSYISGVATELDAQFTDSLGNVSYVYLASVPAAAAWQPITTTFIAPPNVVSVSILHILASNGSLQTDNFALLNSANTPTPVPAPAPAPTPNPDTSGNLVTNPSFESQAADGTPSAWIASRWGTNTTQFTYNTTGQSGTRSATVQTTSYTDGDAKWAAAASAVTANKSYQYSDYYQSTVSTRIVVAFSDASGTYSYTELTAAPPSTNWMQYQTSFTAPASATHATVYHLLSAVGSLSIDTVSLTPAVATDTSGIISNGSFEQSNPSNLAVPYGWQGSNWGTNSTKFNYIANDGHTGTHSSKLTVTNYTSGDAKWYFDPINSLITGQSYTLSAWYKTNTQPSMVGSYVDGAGVTCYFGMPLPLPSSTSATVWQQYKASFSLPAGATSFTAFMLLNRNGWLQTDDFTITPYQPVGFNSAMVSLTFDDGWQSTYTNGLPLLNKYGFTSTQYVLSGDMSGTNGYMTAAQIKAFKLAGSEIASHTVNHADLAPLTTTQIDLQLSQSKATIQKLFGMDTAVNFATPYGSYNTKVLTEVKKYYRSHRSTDTGYNSKDNFNAYNILVQNVDGATSVDQVNAWVSKAAADKTWLVLVYHDVDTTGDAYSVTPAHLDAELNFIKLKGISVKTVNQALNDITPQL